MRILVVGCRLPDEAYPNGANTVGILARDLQIDVVDMRSTMPKTYHLWRAARAGRWRALGGGLRLASAVLISVLRLVREQRKGDVAYLPYPAVPALWLISWMPRNLRPPCIADAYISIWDSLCNDRSRVRAGLLSALIKRVEARALRAATRVLVDTEANKDFYVRQFDLDPSKVTSLPLAVEAASFRRLRCKVPRRANTRVLFFGTMIPLHGIEIVLEAARLLKGREDIEFRLIGDGQLGDEVASTIAKDRLLNVSWRRAWVSLEDIAHEVAESCVCLGVFGGAAKAARVLPFKLYYALAAGKPVISQAMFSLPEGAPHPPMIEVMVVDDNVESGRRLAREIERVADEGGCAEELSRDAAKYYDKYLSTDVLASHWRQMLRAL